MIVSRLVRHSLLSYIKPSQIGQLSFSKTFCTDIDENSYLKLTNETLESISDRFSELIEDHDQLGGGDTQLSDGVLTVKLSQHGTYVLNKQTPNKQIWLSSPVSGPYRYDISQVRSHCSLLHNSGPCAGSLGVQTHGSDPPPPTGRGTPSHHQDRPRLPHLLHGLA